MAYMENWAPKRTVQSVGVDAAPALSQVSAQEKTQGQSAKFRTVSTDSNLNVGNLVKTQGNTKNTGVAGRPSSIARKPWDSTLPATVNPDGEGNRPGSFWK